jgi:predicted HD phosphohydrolase
MIITTFFKVEIPSEYFEGIAKKYGWNELNEETAIEFVKKWFQESVITKRISDELYSFRQKEIQDLNNKILAESLTEAMAAVSISDVQ